MKSRTITVSALAAIAIIVVWWLFLFSPARSNASKVNSDIDAAKEEGRTLDTQVKQLRDLERHAPEIKAQLDKLRQAVPASPDLASFIDQANQIATDTGVKWASVAPSDPTGSAAAGTPTTSNEIQLAISVSGGYYEVLDYLNRLDNMPRLVKVDQLGLTGGTDENGQQSLTASVTARMFVQPAAAATPDASTSPTSVAGGGGVAATPQGQNS
jgi:Tfp pilus assembly protein PilO